MAWYACSLRVDSTEYTVIGSICYCQGGTGPAEEVHQELAGGPLHENGGATGIGVGEAVPPPTASQVKTAAHQPGADKESSGTALAGRAKGKARVSARAKGAKGRLGRPGAASSPPEADTMPAAEAPSAQLGKQLTGAPAAAAQAEHSEYSFPDSGPDANPSVKFERAAARTTRLASASTAQQDAEQAADEMPESVAGRRRGPKKKTAVAQTFQRLERRAANALVEPEDHGIAEQPDEDPEDLPRKSTRTGRRTAKAAQPEAGRPPVSARLKRGSKKAAAAGEAAADQSMMPEQPDLVAGNSDIQEEDGQEDAPKKRSSRRTRGRKMPAPAGKIEAGKKGNEKQPETDEAAATEVPQTKYKVSRITRAAQQRGQDPEQADAGAASAARQAKRDMGKVPVPAPKKRAEGAGSKLTDSSAKRFAGLTESQAAADTLAKVGNGLAQEMVHVYLFLDVQHRACIWKNPVC